MSEPASGSLAPLAPMSDPSDKPGRYRWRWSSVPWMRIGIEFGPEVRVQRKQEPLIARAVSQPLHDGKEGRETEAEAAVLLRDRHPQNAEPGAGLPTVAIEHLVLVGVNPAAAETRSGEFDRAALQLLLMGVELEVHARMPLDRQFPRRSALTDMG